MRCLAVPLALPVSLGAPELAVKIAAGASPGAALDIGGVRTTPNANPDSSATLLSTVLYTDVTPWSTS